jgi:putative endonuclease
VDDTRQTLGAAGEDAALRLYLGRGYRLVARNWRCRLGELDLILSRRGVLVICEVKARRGDAFGGGWEAVTARKQAKIRAVSQAFLQASGARPGVVRFDVASVAMRAHRSAEGPLSAQVELFEDAF